MNLLASAPSCIRTFLCPQVVSDTYVLLFWDNKLVAVSSQFLCLMEPLMRSSNSLPPFQDVALINSKPTQLVVNDAIAVFTLIFVRLYIPLQTRRNRFSNDQIRPLPRFS